MDFLKGRREHISDFVEDVTGLFYSSRNRTLSENQLKTLWEFKNACRIQLANGNSILSSIPPINEFGSVELRYAMHVMKEDVDNFELVLGETNTSTIFPIAGSIPGAVMGASTGYLCGAPTAVVDAGIMAGVCAIIGGLIGAATCSANSNAEKEIEYLVRALTRLVDDTKNVEKYVRKAYGLV